MDIKAGDALVFTEGIYSDYGITSHAKAVIDFSLEAKRREFIATLTEDEKTYWYSLPEKFVAWLIAERVIEDTDSITEIYLDSEDFIGRG